MRAIEISKFGGPDVLQVRELPSPSLAPDAIRIRVRAAGVNFADLVMRMGMYPEAPKPPFVPGYEIAGDVLEVGPKAETTLRPGARVLAGARFGGYCSEICLPAGFVRPIPEPLSYEEAASIPVNWMTASVAMEDMARCRAGDRVLVESAAGGVGVAAVQIGFGLGVKVIGLVGSPAKAKAVLDLGAAEVWSNDEWKSAAKDTERFDLVLSSAGGGEMKRAFRRLTHTGRVVNFGASSMVQGKKRNILTVVKTLLSMPLYTPIKLMMENKGVYGLNMLALMEHDVLAVQRSIDRVLEGFKAKRYRAVVGKTFPLEEAGKAHDHLQSRGNIGKVVLTVS